MKTTSTFLPRGLIALTLLIALGAQVQIGQGQEQAPGFYRIKISDYTVTSVSDGSTPLPFDHLLTDISPAEVKARLATNHEPLPLPTSVNAFVVDTGSKRILIDAGAGTLFKPYCGELTANLTAAGYPPDKIDVVLLTHIHGDHSGGLTVGGQRVFLNADVYVSRAERDYWFDPEKEAAAPADRKHYFREGQAALQPYIVAGRLKTFDAPADLFPGISAVPEPGHTPGMSGYRIERAGQALLLWGDIVHAADIQFASPKVTIVFDVEPKAAAQRRALVLADAASKGYLIGAAHISFPGFGHVRKDRTGYAWIPAPYNSRP